MAYSFLSRFRVKSECDAEFVGLIAEMEANATAEQDTLAYKFYRLDGDGMFGVYESFTDEQGDQAHQANPANGPIIEKMIACMAGGYERELLYDVTPAA